MEGALRHTLHGIHPSCYGCLYLPLYLSLSRRTFASFHVRRERGKGKEEPRAAPVPRPDSLHL